MPRAGGIYSAPAGTLVVPNTTIESSRYNAFVNDIVQDANTARPITAGGTGATSAGAALTALGGAGLGLVNAFTEMQKWALGTAIDDDDVVEGDLTLPTDGNTFAFTGAEAVDAIATLGVGTTVRFLHGSARTFTHSTDLVCPGGINLIVASGDVTEWLEYASGDWQCIQCQRSTGLPGMEILARGTVSGAASLDITGLSTAHRAYKLVFDNLKPANDDVSLWFRTSTDNGSSFSAGASDYEWGGAQFQNNGIVAGTGDNADSEITLNNSGFGNASGETGSGEITFYAPASSANNAKVVSQINVTNAGGAHQYQMFSGSRLAAEVNNAIRLLFSSGNIATMNWTLYGLRAS